MPTATTSTSSTPSRPRGARAWPSRSLPEVVPLAADPHLRPTLAARTDSIVVLLFGRWRPEAEVTPPDVRGDDEHVELMLGVARDTD